MLQLLFCNNVFMVQSVRSFYYQKNKVSKHCKIYMLLCITAKLIYKFLLWESHTFLSRRLLKFARANIIFDNSVLTFHTFTEELNVSATEATVTNFEDSRRTALIR